MAKEIQLPEGWEVDKIENGKLFLKESKKSLPKTWLQWVKQNNQAGDEYYINSNAKIYKVSSNYNRDAEIDASLLPTREMAKAILALIQLIRLRDAYRQGWKPNWENDNITKYMITLRKNQIYKSMHWLDNSLLAFQSEELRNKFYYNFKDLIEKIKPLYE